MIQMPLFIKDLRCGESLMLPDELRRDFFVKTFTARTAAVTGGRGSSGGRRGKEAAPHQDSEDREAEPASQTYRVTGVLTERGHTGEHRHSPADRVKQTQSELHHLLILKVMCRLEDLNILLFSLKVSIVH